MSTGLIGCDEHQDFNDNCIACVKRENHALKSKNHALQSKNHALQSKNLELKEHSPSFQDIIGFDMRIYNQTASSPHVHTGHRPAKFESMEVPNFALPDSFFKFRPLFRVRDQPSINSEAQVKYKVVGLINEVIHALDFAHTINAELQIPIMDTTPDVIIKTTLSNSLLAGTIEVKKDSRTDQEHRLIFGSDTEVAGEVFEQVFLARANLLGENSFGLLTTYNGWQLVSTEKITNNTDLEVEKSKVFFANKKKVLDTTPDRPQAGIRPESNLEAGEVLPSAEKKVKTTEKPKGRPSSFSKEARNEDRVKKGMKATENTNGYECGRVAELSQDAPRSYYASKVVEFGKPEENQKVLELIAVYVLLVLKSFRTYAESGKSIASMKRFPARFVDPSKSVFSLTEIELNDTINFNSTFDFNAKCVFYALQQLGYGSDGVSCLAINQNTNVCVLKFLHALPVSAPSDAVEERLEKAKEEAKNWNTINGMSAGAFKIGNRVVIAMPYLLIASDFVDRSRLIEGGETSILYRGLTKICRKGFVHEDVFWHHVGVQVHDPDECYLCDLGRVAKHEFTENEMAEWVNENFVRLKEQIGQY